MKDPAAKKAHAYFQNHQGDLQSVFSKVQALNALHAQVITYLDPHLAPYCQVANLLANRLIIIAANGSIATQLRFQTPDLIQKFKQDPLLRTIQDIHCKVRPVSVSSRLQTTQKTKHKVQLLSAESAAIIQEIAVSMQDPKLQAALKRIAKHTLNSHNASDGDE